jgi:hypothetical protein
MVFQTPLDRGETRAGRPRRRSTLLHGYGVHTDAITDLEGANLLPVPPATALLKAKQLQFTPGTPGWGDIHTTLPGVPGVKT